MPVENRRVRVNCGESHIRGHATVLGCSRWDEPRAHMPGNNTSFTHAIFRRLQGAYVAGFGTTLGVETDPARLCNHRLGDIEVVHTAHDRVSAGDIVGGFPLRPITKREYVRYRTYIGHRKVTGYLRNQMRFAETHGATQNIRRQGPPLGGI